MGMNFDNEGSDIQEWDIGSVALKCKKFSHFEV